MSWIWYLIVLYFLCHEKYYKNVLVRECWFMKHNKLLNDLNLKETACKGGCGECQTSCQSACKTSCTVANQKCENEKQR